MAEKCPVCKIGDLTNVADYPDFEESFYSCGHHPKLFKRSIEEPPEEIDDTASSSKPPLNISDSAKLLVKKLEQSPNITIEEKLYEDTPTLQFSADGTTKFFINNSTINIILTESKDIAQNISPTNILEKIQPLIQESKPNSLEENKEESSFLQTFTGILAKRERLSGWARLKYRFAGKKWVFPATTPLILRIIDIIMEEILEEEGR